MRICFSLGSSAVLSSSPPCFVKHPAFLARKYVATHDLNDAGACWVHARKSALVLERMEERVAVQITVDPTPNAATFPEPRIKCSVKVVPSFPALRTIHATRTTASGTSHQTFHAKRATASGTVFRVYRLQESMVQVPPSTTLANL
eukprot:scaffold250744_cov19-Tisochrysis_lutea.AAC.3